MGNNTAPNYTDYSEEVVKMEEQKEEQALPIAGPEEEVLKKVKQVIPELQALYNSGRRG